MGTRRVAAGLVDMALLVLPGVALYLISELASVIYAAFFTFSATLYFSAFHILHAQTPGKRWFGLRVTGKGCILCRELRKCAILFAPFAFAVVDSIAQMTPILMISFVYILEYGWPVALVFVLGFTLFPIITLLFNKPPHWDRATGFTVTRA